jgi:tripartite-type tricarboxylate transporter receptor subunit TctC
VKKLISCIAFAVALPMMVAALPAQADYPTAPVTIVVPYPPGGTTDVLARILADGLTERLGQPVVVENRPGGGGAVGMAMVAQVAPDGHTLVAGTILTHGIHPAIRDDLPYDPVADFTPISLLANTPNVFLANVDTDFHTVADVIEHAQANPGELSFGSTSVTGSPHMSGELLKALADIDMVHIPYQGGGPLLAAIIGGEIPLGFDNLPSASGHIRAGSVRPLAVTTTERWPEHSDIPTFQEAGVEGYDVTAWFGILAPAGVPEEVISVLEMQIAEVLAEDEVREQLAQIGAEAVGSTSAEFGQRIEDEIQRWRTVVQEVDIDLE